ncbi:MAG: NAD(P)H-dependent oxidoreductase subunit E [Phycisphaerales bacterium]|jgi:NADH:ubiquinone oxidoreductase subunit E|nr:NAD(P)H-dependent oxidoreductase subunit E [Phycisphaerales bacterium]
MSWKAKPSATTDPVSLDVLADLEKPAGGSFVTDALRSRWTAEIIPKYATRHGALMPILHDLQHAYRCIPYQAMIDVALFLEIPPAEVLDTTSFYEEYHTEPVGRCVVGVCQSIACEVCGHQAIVDHIRNRLDLEPHETDDEGRFTLLLLECLGSCDTAPVALFNDELAENLVISQVDAILDEVEATPIDQLDREAVRAIVRKHATTQAGREPGESGQT